jgi:hypothetical protein
MMDTEFLERLDCAVKQGETRLLIEADDLGGHPKAAQLNAFVQENRPTLGLTIIAVERVDLSEGVGKKNRVDLDVVEVAWE